MTPAWTAKLAPEDSEKLAKRAIFLLEKHIHDAYGITVSMGAELEFSANVEPSHPSHQAGAKTTTLSEALYRPLHHKPANDATQNPYYAGSPYIANLHREAGKITGPIPYQQYEIVFSHLAAYGTIAQGRLVNLGRAIAHEKQRLLNDNAITHVSFSPNLNGEHDVDYIANGLHLNYSLTRSDGTSPLTANSDAMAYGDSHRKKSVIAGNASDTIIKATQHMQREAQYLLGNDADTIDRLDHMQMNQDLFSLRMSDNGLYIENRTPPASCNPYFAVMTALAGIAHGLDALSNDSTLHPAMIGISDFNIEQNFRRSTHLIPLLNRLEPELGTRLQAAALATHKTESLAR